MVVQWLRIHLAMQRTQVQFLVRELRSHMPSNNWAHVLQLLKPVRSGDRALQLLSWYTLGPMCHNKRAHVPQLVSLGTKSRVCKLQRKIPHDASKTPCATTKTNAVKYKINIKNKQIKLWGLSTLCLWMRWLLYPTHSDMQQKVENKEYLK